MKQKYYVKTCIDCGGETKVVDSRVDPSGFLYRRRKCDNCGFSFATLEIEDSVGMEHMIKEELTRLRKENTLLKEKIKSIKQLLK